MIQNCSKSLWKAGGHKKGPQIQWMVPPTWFSIFSIFIISTSITLSPLLELQERPRKPRDGGWRRDPALWDKAGLTARAAWQDAPMAILGSHPTPDPAMYICLTESRQDLVPCPLCPLCPLCLMLGPMFWSAVTFVAHRYQAHITLGPSCRSWQIKPSFSFKMLNKYCLSKSLNYKLEGAFLEVSND